MIADRENLDITEPPKVTIAIPTYNRAAFLTEALDSAIGQTYQNIEVIVSDNASTDNTLQLLGNYNDDRLIVIQQETNLGMVGNWNACLEMASGEFFILLSDDDFLDPTAIEEMVKGFQCLNSRFDSSKIGMVYCGTRIIDEENKAIENNKSDSLVEHASSFIPEYLRGKRSVYPCGVLIRKDDLREYGGFDGKNYSLAADANIWMRIVINRGIAVYIGNYLSNYRLHIGSVTSRARIDEWVDNASALIDLCANQFMNQSDFVTAQLIIRLRRRFTINLVYGLIQRSADAGASRISLVAHYVKYYKLYSTPYGIFVGVFGIAKMFMPKYMLRLLKIARRITQFQRSQN